MNLFEGKVIMEGFRAIGLKDTDKERLAEASKEASFDQVEAVVEPVPSVQEETPVMESTESVVEPNIFDQASPVIESTVVSELPESPVVEETNTYNEDVFTAPVVNEDNTLDTPQTFFNREEMEEANTQIKSEDPAIILTNNLVKLIEDKNQMIEVLNNKIDVLSEQLRQSEEARKVSDAQRVAAETTLAEARRAETADGGPTLVYQSGQAA